MGAIKADARNLDDSSYVLPTSGAVKPKTPKALRPEAPRLTLNMHRNARSQCR